MATENEGQSRFAHLAELPALARAAATDPKECPNQSGSRADDYEDEDEDKRDRKRDEEEDAKRAKRKRAAAARRRAKAKAEEEEAERHDEEEEDEHASEEEDERKEDEKEGKRKARAEERRRIKAILGCEAADRNVKGAWFLAFDTDDSSAKCIAQLKAFAPASDGAPPARYSGDSLRSRMALVENPAVGANDGVDLSNQDPVKMAAAAIIQAGRKRRGEI